MPMTLSNHQANAPLPDDLAALERALAERPTSSPARGLREQVMAAVRIELCQRGHRNGRRQLWQWLAASAAAVLVAVNFSTSVINNMDWRLAKRAEPVAIDAAARQLQALAPGLSPEDARRHAFLLGAGARTAPAPYGRPTLDQFLQQRERESWDMH
jgi:hypothetical protein